MEAKHWGYWNIKDNVIAEGRKYKTLSDFKHKSNGAWFSAHKHNWLIEMDWFEQWQKPNGYWTKERVFEEARKYSRMIDFHRDSNSAYTIACRNGWLKEMTWLSVKKYNIKKNEKKPVGYWQIKEHCIEEAKKYKTKKELYTKSSGCYASILDHKWMDELDWLNE
mgnify:CR=1 FL=1